VFSKTCEYGLRASLYIAKKSAEGKLVGLLEISEAIDSPSAFTAKILQKLVLKKIIKSIKGPYGGFKIEVEKLQTPLIEIVEIFDGNHLLNNCSLGLKSCDPKKPCPLHFQFVKVKKELQEVLENNTLYNLATDPMLLRV